MSDEVVHINHEVTPQQVVETLQKAQKIQELIQQNINHEEFINWLYKLLDLE